jgi:hypothetical protein
MMFRKRERERESGAVLQLAAEKGQRGVTEALLGC